MKGYSKSTNGVWSCWTLAYAYTLLPLVVLWLATIDTVKGFQHGPTLIRTMRILDSTSTSTARGQRFSVLDSFPKNDLESEQHETESDKGITLDFNEPWSRRRALQLIATSAALVSIAPQDANAGKAEIDSRSGELFSPRKDMLGGGGSDLARGIKLESSNSGATNGVVSQSIYETRFITYLSRFLLNYDPAAKSWWNEQDFSGNGKQTSEAQKKITFAEFAESVEVGLANYFVGPYGSYASVQAAKAGLLANAPAQSSSVVIAEVKTGFFESLKKGKIGAKGAVQPLADKKARDNSRKGVLNLLSLLQARYTSSEEKRQLAILFSLISDPMLQPSRQIKGILGESDDASVADINVIGLLNDGDNFRGSSRRGGGYLNYEKPNVIIDAPPALGASYTPAKIEVKTKPTSRVLRIRVLDGGRGYTSIPNVEVIQQGVTIQCEATAILDREGSVESVIVLDPGFGYGKYNKKVEVVPEVRIAPPKKPKGAGAKDKKKLLPAFAIADLEYAVSDVRIEDGGNGYILNQPPKAFISPPEEDADWYLSPIDKKTWRAIDLGRVDIEVTKMKCRGKGGMVEIQSDEGGEEINRLASDTNILENMTTDPLALLPSDLQLHFTAPRDIIPEIGIPALRDGNYRILSLPVAASATFLPSRYRAFDPIFGAIGSKPVTKNALALTGSEYTRLALSGGICTVIVRTALNPLELVKTKVQLKTDEELMQAVAARPTKVDASNDKSEKREKKEASVGTLDVIKTMVSTRGPFSLFQSADITFLASVVFGSFGFGATELFRRSFSMVFFGDTAGGKGSGEELTFLLAAGLACVLTSLAAAPFEILRVRSMGYVEAEPVLTVFSDFLVSPHS